MATAADERNGECEGVGEGEEVRDLGAKGECEASGEGRDEADGSYVFVNGGEADQAEGGVIAEKVEEGVVVMDNAGLVGNEGPGTDGGDESNGESESGHTHGSVVDSGSDKDGHVEGRDSLELKNDHDHEGSDASSDFHILDGSSEEKCGQVENGQLSNGNGHVAEDDAARDPSSEVNDPTNDQSSLELAAEEESPTELTTECHSLPNLALEHNGHDHGEQCAVISDFEVVDDVKAQPASNLVITEAPELLEKTDENGLKTEEAIEDMAADVFVAEEKYTDLTTEVPAEVQGTRELEIHINRNEEEGVAKEELVTEVDSVVEGSLNFSSDTSTNEGSCIQIVLSQEENTIDATKPVEVEEKQNADVFVNKVVVSETQACENGREISGAVDESPPDVVPCYLVLDEGKSTHKESETQLENGILGKCETALTSIVEVVEPENVINLPAHNLDMLIASNEPAMPTESEVSEKITPPNEESSVSREICIGTEHGSVNENETEEEVTKSSVEIESVNANEMVASSGVDMTESDDNTGQVTKEDGEPVSSSWAEVVEMESAAIENSEEHKPAPIGEMETCSPDIAAASHDNDDVLTPEDTFPVDARSEPLAAESLTFLSKKDDATDESTAAEVSCDASANSVKMQIADSIQGQNTENESKHQPFYMIRVPFFHDDGLMTQKQALEMQVEEKTRNRDSISATMQAKKVSRDQCWRELDSVRQAEKAARDAFNAKRQERVAIQSMVNRMNNVNSIDNIDDKIRDLEHRIQHETITLKEEKQLIREIKLFKQNREHLFSSVGTEDEVQEAFLQKDSINENFKSLNKELDTCKHIMLQAEMNSKTCRKKYDEQMQILTDLRVQYSAADQLRQEAFTQLKNVKKALHERNLQYYQYKDNRRAAETYALSGDKEALRCHCSEQVEKFMELWNKNDDFRKQYVKSSMFSIVRRFRTLDGRSLGLNEQPVVLPNLIRDRPRSGPLPGPKVDSVLSSETKQENKNIVASESVDTHPSSNMPKKDSSIKPKKSSKASSKDAVVMEVSSEAIPEQMENEKQNKDDELKRIANELARKEEEMTRKEEEIRKEKAAADVKEKHRLEQIAKAKKAEERKKKRAEKAKAKAEIRAKKESEDKEKKKAKKESQKGKKLVGATDADNIGTEAESLPAPATFPCETVEEIEVKVPTVSKRPAAAKHQTKIKPIPLPLRNRGKRKMQTWMWVLLSALVLVLLFIVGNYVSPSKISLPYIGF